MSRNFLSDIDTLSENYADVSRQVSSGKKLNQLKDSPSGSAELVNLTKTESDVDQYTSNTNAGSLYMKAADSSLNEVNNLLTSIYTKASQGASNSVNSDDRAALASDIRSMRDQIVSLANTEAQGRYIFAGSKVTSAPFSQEGDSVAYNGDDNVNSILVDYGTEAQMNFSGDAVFSPIFTTIDSLLAGMDSNDISSIKTALDKFSSTQSGLGQVRTQVGTNMSLLENVQTSLNSQQTNLKEQRSNIEDANMSQAVVQMNQTQTALQAAMSAGSTMLSQRNLFDILG
jgi:flagellar hook-associated protein 3 FlgL